MKKKKEFSDNKQPIIGIVTMFFVVLLIMISVGNYYITVKTNEISDSDTNLNNLAKSNIFSAQAYFEGQKASLRAIAFALEGYEDLTSDEVINFLKNSAERLGYERLAIDFLDGSSYTSDGSVFDVSNMGFLENVRRGEHFIGDVKIALADGSDVVSVFAPIFKDGKPIAAVRSAIGTDEITKKIAIDFAGEEYYFHLIDGEGKYVADNSSSNALLMEYDFFEAMQELTYEKDYSYDKFRMDIKAGKSGYMKYSYEGQGRYAYYTPAGINDWIMMTIVPKDVVEGLIGNSLHTTIILSLEIMTALLILFGYILWEQRKARLKTALDESCFRVLSEQTGNIIFEWDFKKRKVISMSSNFEKVFGRQPYTIHSEMEAIQAKAIHPDDISTFTDVFHKISLGQNVKDIKFRIRDVRGEFIWCSISGVAVNYSNGKPFKAIGSIRSIDDEEKEVQTLRDNAQKDLLTDLYNKLSTEALVSEYMKESSPSDIGALLMIDIDNFKGVNDTLGHQFGDQVLIDTAVSLKQIFRTSDILGRVGGDEFIVFMKDVLDRSIVLERAKDICSNTAETFIGDQMYKVSTSVGIAMYPQHGTDFRGLYNHADIALYQAKRNGKNNYMFYESTGVVIPVKTKNQIKGR